MPGVLCILTAAEWEARGLGRLLPCLTPVPFDDGRPMNEVNRPIFAKEVVQHCGDTLAAVVAETLSEALDAAECVEVDYEELPAVVDIAVAVEADAPVIHDVLDSNIVYRVAVGDAAATAVAFERAAHVTELEMRNHRITGNPMEPRACIGHYDAPCDRYTLWAATQFPHALRRWIAECTLRVPMQKVRVIAPDVGGGFGTKAYFYMEHSVVLWASRLIGRSVRFTAARSDGLLTDAHARDHFTKARMAFDAEGHVLGLDIETVAGFGAYQSQFNAFIPARYYPTVMTGLYRTPTMHVKVTGVYTNTAPIDAYRGSAQSAASVGERLIDNGARELGIDPEEIRRLNYIEPDEYPYELPSGTVYDSGNPPGQHALLLALANYRALREEQQRLKQQGICLGLGLSGFAEAGGHGPSRQTADQLGAKQGWWEGARVQIHPDGARHPFGRHALPRPEPRHHVSSDCG